MGMDQRLELITPVSDELIKFINGHNCQDIPLYEFGVHDLYVDEEDIKSARYDNIRDIIKTVQVYRTHIDWDLIKETYNIPDEYKMKSLGGTTIVYAPSYDAPKTDQIEVFVNAYDKKWKKKTLDTVYVCHMTELYRWRNNYDIHNIFDKHYADEYDDYHKKMRSGYGKYYPITDVFDEMKKVDPEFAAKYKYNTDNVFYSADW